MPGKVWKAEEEAQLRALVEANLNVDEIAAKLKKTPKAVITKSQRLGLQLQVKGYVDTAIDLPRELLSVEETAKILSGVLKASVKPGLNRLEVQRLMAVANISKTYKEIIVDYIHMREVEEKLEEVVEQNAALQQAIREIRERTPSLSPQPVPS